MVPRDPATAACLLSSPQNIHARSGPRAFAPPARLVPLQAGGHRAPSLWDRKEIACRNSCLVGSEEQSGTRRGQRVGGSDAGDPVFQQESRFYTKYNAKPLEGFQPKSEVT